MKIIFLLIVLAFPFLEAAVLLQLFDVHGWWVVGWLCIAAVMGVVLIKQARFALVARVASDLARGQFSLAALIDSARTVVAGMLLIFPGIISDTIAVVMMLLPVSRPAMAYGDTSQLRARQTGMRRTAHVIDGDFRRE